MMTVRAKTLVKDKFWIVEENGTKLGTLQKQADNGWIFLSKQKETQVFHTQESLFKKFGFHIFNEPVKQEEKEVDKWDVKQAERIEVPRSRVKVIIVDRIFFIISNFMQDKLFLKRDKQKKPAWNLSKLVFLKR